MTRTALLAIAVAITLAVPWRAHAAPGDGSARAAALEALAAKADLPSARPALPSLLVDREVGRGDGSGDGQGNAARDEAKGASKSEAAKAHAASANAEAAHEAKAAKDDAHGAAEKNREDKTRKKPKPPHPPNGGN
jgi:hypothetical protein